MAKKKGPGRDVNNSLESMEGLISALKDFGNMPLKKGLVSNKIDDADLQKMLDKAVVDAVSLLTQVGNIAEKVRGLKLNKSSRFSDRETSCRAVVAGFLSSKP